MTIMTLEQIKLQQQQLNSRLMGISDSLSTTTTKITGCFISPEEEKENPAPDGLLSEISREQEKTESILDALSKVSNRLVEFTYLPSEPCLAKANN